MPVHSLLMSSFVANIRYISNIIPYFAKVPSFPPPTPLPSLSFLFSNASHFSSFSNISVPLFFFQDKVSLHDFHFLRFRFFNSRKTLFQLHFDYHRAKIGKQRNVFLLLWHPFISDLGSRSSTLSSVYNVSQ